MSVTTDNISNHIVRITINRPEVHNAINFEVINKLEEIIGEVEQKQSTRVIILRGAGEKSFISGGDLREFHTLTDKREAEKMARRMLRILSRLENLPCWSIACINGNAYGGGCEIALALDFRISYPGVTLGFTQSRFYLPPGWGGLTRLVERIGRATALKWLGGGEKITGREALRHQFLDRLPEYSELENATLSWAQELAKNDRAFISNLKERANHIFINKEESIRQETKKFAEFWVSKEHMARVDQFINKKSDTP